MSKFPTASSIGGLRLNMFCTMLLSLTLLGAACLTPWWIVSLHEGHDEAISAIEKSQAKAARVVELAAQTTTLTSSKDQMINRRELTYAAQALHRNIQKIWAVLLDNDLDTPQVAAIREASPHQFDTNLQQFSHHLAAIKQRGDAAGSARLLNRIVRLQAGPLANGFKALSDEIERSGAWQITQMKLAAAFLAAVTVLIFLLQWIFFYRPLGHAIQYRNRDLVQANAQIKRAALFDDLTELPNRANLFESLANRTPTEDAIGIINIDLLRFREINDIFGWDVGDKVLHHVGQVLQTFRQNREYVARFGPNNFIFATTTRMQSDALSDLAAMIAFSLSRPIVINGHELALNPVLGITARSEETRDATVESLIADSQIALAKAKIEGGPVYFNTRMRDQLAERRQTACDLARAFERDEIEPFFQPQVRAKDGRVIGFEALVRWRHPERGVLAPAAFLDICDSANLNSKLSQVVVNKSLQALNEWRRHGFDIATIGLNFTAREMRDPEFADRLLFDIDLAGLQPSDVSVEVLETAHFDQQEDMAKDSIARLANAGCRIDLDDFGTGHASLSNLLLLTVDRLKIDRSFISGLHEAPERRQMTDAMLRLAETLGIETLAEGVESHDEWRLLIELGCDALQGYGIAKPMPASVIVGWLVEHERRVAEGLIVAA